MTWSPCVWCGVDTREYDWHLCPASDEERERRRIEREREESEA